MTNTSSSLSISPNDSAALIRQLPALKAIQQSRRFRRIETYFRDSGPYARALYPKHLEFFIAGGQHQRLPSCPEDCDGSAHRERLFMAANRVGKSDAAAYEMSVHLTGRYPDWWEGRRFKYPVKAWAANKSGKDCRDVNQLKLLGDYKELGTGMIPRDAIVGRPPSKYGVSEGIESVTIRHASGLLSFLSFKSYDQGAVSFAGREQHIIWLDEEPPLDVYTECLLRTMTCDGMIMMTFTPLLGMSEVIQQFLPSGLKPGNTGDTDYGVDVGHDGGGTSDLKPSQEEQDRYL